jgi:hypothetical protein
MFLVYQKIPYFLTKNASTLFPFGVQKKFLCDHFWLECIMPIVMPFLNSSSAIAHGHEKIVNNITPPRTKIGFH